MIRNKKPGQTNKPQNTTQNIDIKTEKNDDEIKENWDDEDDVLNKSKVESVENISISKSGDNVGSDSLTKDSSEIKKSKDHWDEDDNVQDNWDDEKKRFY